MKEDVLGLSLIHIFWKIEGKKYARAIICSGNNIHNVFNVKTYDINFIVGYVVDDVSDVI